MPEDSDIREDLEMPEDSNMHENSKTEILDESPIQSAFHSMQETMKQLETTTGLPPDLLFFHWKEFNQPIKEAERELYERYFKVHPETELGRIKRNMAGDDPHETRPIVTFTWSIDIDPDLPDPEVIERCFFLFREERGDWRNVLDCFHAEDRLDNLPTREHVEDGIWERYLEELRALV